MKLSYPRLTKDRAIEVVDIFNDCFGNNCKLNIDLLNTKLFDTEDYFEDASFICLDGGFPCGFIAAKLSDNSLPEYQNTGFISLFAVRSDYQFNGIGTELLNLAIDQFKNQGVKTVLLSQDLNNFFSGIPQPTKDSVNFFKNRGFTLNRGFHWDLCSDLSKNNLQQYIYLINLTNDYKTIPAKEEDKSAIKIFMQKEFPGRWDFEVSSTFKDGTLPHILLLKKGKEIKGFCRVRLGDDTNGNEYYLGADCGALGPIGIAADIRKQGLGLRLLYDSLTYLKENGAHKTNIDWTELRDFYGILGFKPWRTYIGAYLDI